MTSCRFTRRPDAAHRTMRCSTTRDLRGAPLSPRTPATTGPLLRRCLVAGKSHAGVVFTTDKRWPRSDPGALINAFDELLKSTVGQPIDAELWL
jgi:hypothetical protein